MIDHFAPWWQNPICVVDFETTSADPETCAPVQVACMLLRHDKADAHWSTLINPGVPIPEEASAIHGIRDEDVVEAPTPYMAIGQAAAHMEGAIPCAYNAPFDSRIMLRVGAPAVANMPWIDPLVMIRHFDRWVPGSGRHKLEATCKRWGVSFDNAHDAAGDAMATARLLMAMKLKLGNMTYSELIRRQRLKAAEQEREFQEWLAKQPKTESQ